MERMEREKKSMRERGERENRRMLVGRYKMPR
jgi:hypothetical protein